MKLNGFIALIAALLATAASAETITVSGIIENGEGGVYQINGSNYWWMCVEPQTPALNTTITAELISFSDGWSRQNNERSQIYAVDDNQLVIPRQIGVMSYVLDNYLPWAQAGAGNPFSGEDIAESQYNNNELFYNSFFAIQNFLAETYGKALKTDFNNLADYDNYFDAEVSAAGIARRDIFDAILLDVAGQSMAFFDSYTAEHTYLIVNTQLDFADPANWQDGLMIYSFAPVPEPGGAALIASCGLAWMLRRKKRRLA